MPVLFKLYSYVIYFSALDANEPAHVHIGIKRPKKNDTKIWVGGGVRLAHNKGGIPDKDLHKLLLLIKMNEQRIIKAWQDFFAD